MPELTPLSDNRKEHFLNGEVLEPLQTRREYYYAGREDELPPHQPTREELFIQKYRGGGGDVTVVPLSVTENGTYSEEGKAYSPVSVNVPLPQNAYLLKSVANLPQAIASFNDGEEMVMPSLKVAIEPQQEGSGDPSPTNVRPIIGWDEMDLSVSGKNLFDKTATDTSKGFIPGKWINQTGNTFLYSNWSVSEYIRVDGEKIAVSGMTVAEQVSSGRGGYCCYDKYKNVLGGGVYNALTQIITLPTNTEYIQISVWKENKDVCQLELGSTATTYEPYNGQTYTIDLDGTRYGGEVDVVSGIVTPAPYYASYNGEALTGEWISDRDKYEVGATPTIGAQVVNIGASGTPVSILPTAIKSLRGVNNVYANTGDIKDAEYFSKEV